MPAAGENGGTDAPTPAIDLNQSRIAEVPGMAAVCPGGMIPPMVYLPNPDAACCRQSSYWS